MKTQWRAVPQSAPYAVILAVALTLAPRAEAGECASRNMRVTFYTCGEGFSHCLTKQGHQPIPFRTVAVGDRSLLGRWLYIEDLGGWVLAADTGVALKKQSIDVFIGEGRMAAHARRLGVQHWDVRICELPQPVQRARNEVERESSAGASETPRHTLAAVAAVR